MNPYVVIIALLCSTLTLQAEIINGYHQEKLILERNIRKLQLLLSEHSDSKSAKQLVKQLKKLQKQYVTVTQKYVQTEELIHTIATVDPQLFHQVSQITNAEGTLTNVVVRYVSRASKEFTYFTSKFYAADAYTSVRQEQNHEHACTSLYGTNTITITVGTGCNQIKALGHEFAHVMYIVPNLKEYMDFWNHQQEFLNGHSISDPGYFVFHKLENRFLQNYMQYVKMKIQPIVDNTHLAFNPLNDYIDGSSNVPSLQLPPDEPANIGKPTITQ